MVFSVWKRLVSTCSSKIILLETMQNVDDLTYEYILSEIKRIKYLYKLNTVIRYNLKREEKHQTQSVAEHVTNMLFLAYYFRPFEDPKNKLNFDHVVKLIMMHDLGEIETGDYLATIKNADHKKEEKEAIVKVRLQSPKFVADQVENLYEEFESLKTRESLYVNAIDKFEGQVFWVEEKGVEMVTYGDSLYGVDISTVHPPYIKKIHTFLKENNFHFIDKYLSVVDSEKEKVGLRSNLI